MWSTERLELSPRLVGRLGFAEIQGPPLRRLASFDPGDRVFVRAAGRQPRVQPPGEVR